MPPYSAKLTKIDKITFDVSRTRKRKLQMQLQKQMKKAKGM